MKISNITFSTYKWSRKQIIRNGTMSYNDGQLLLVRVIVDSGVIGYGWIGGTAAERPLNMFLPFCEYLRPKFVGTELNFGSQTGIGVEHLLIKTFGLAAPHCQILGAIDCAIWDALGKVAGKPVYEILGTEPPRRKLRAYVAGGYYRGENPGSVKALDDLQQEFVFNTQKIGARSVKMKIGERSVSLKVDTARVRAVREAIGTDIELMVDANCAFKSLDEAVEYARAFEPYDIAWFEEPFRPDMVELHAEFARLQSIPVAGGENIPTIPLFESCLRLGSFRYANADVAILAGGYSAGREIGNLCKKFDVILAPHGCQELQCHLLAACGTEESRLEMYPSLLDPQRAEIFPNTIQIAEDGFVELGKLPGIGYLPSEEALKPFLLGAI